MSYTMKDYMLLFKMNSPVWVDIHKCLLAINYVSPFSLMALMTPCY
jgi:hypothetical protein